MRLRVAAGFALAALTLTAACGSAATDQVAAVPALTPASPGSETVAAPGVRVVDVDTAADLLAEGDRIVIDVRTPAEYDDARLAGARLIDIASPTFAEEIAALDRDLPYVIYCRTANRSASARQLMEELGFTDVADIGGGIVAWSAAGREVER